MNKEPAKIFSRLFYLNFFYTLTGIKWKNKNSFIILENILINGLYPKNEY